MTPRIGGTRGHYPEEIIRRIIQSTEIKMSGATVAPASEFYVAAMSVFCTCLQWPLLHVTLKTAPFVPLLHTSTISIASFVSFQENLFSLSSSCNAPICSKTPTNRQHVFPPTLLCIHLFQLQDCRGKIYIMGSVRSTVAQRTDALHVEDVLDS